MGRLCLALAVLVACGSNGSGDDLGDYESISVEPAVATLTIALGATATQDYKVFGINGSSKTDVTSLCALAMDADFGSFSNATATVVARGGKTTITAACGTLTGTAPAVLDDAALDDRAHQSIQHITLHGQHSFRQIQYVRRSSTDIVAQKQ